MTKTQLQELIDAQWNIIHDRVAKLSNTDYIAAKIAEDMATTEEYADMIATRQGWRVDINNAQAEIESLSSVEPEEDEPVIE